MKKQVKNCYLLLLFPSFLIDIIIIYDKQAGANMELLIGAIIVVLVLVIRSMNTKAKATNAYNAIDWATTWLLSNQLDAASVQFAAYDNPILVRNQGATAIAGNANNANGERVGFAIEVVPTAGVVYGGLIHPSAIASWHKLASQHSAAYGKPLVDVLMAMAAKHRAEHGNGG